MEIENVKPTWVKLKIFLAIGTRIVLIGECVGTLLLTLCIMETQYYMVLIAHMAVIAIDGIYSAVKNHGEDYKWY
jgi:hypothetical protein